MSWYYWLAPVVAYVYFGYLGVSCWRKRGSRG